jgi:predicted HTH transcriptional regulator
LNLELGIYTMPSYIQKLITQGEHQQLDFKFEVSDARKIARSMVAFANTDGGTLLIGVKDNGAIAGVRSEEEIYMIDAAATMYCKPEIKYSVQTWNEQGKSVLEVKIPKSLTPPHYANDDKGKWLVYIRVKDQNLLANSIWLKVLKRKQNPEGTMVRYRESEKILLDYLSENPFITLSKFSRIAVIPENKAETILVNLISLGIIEMEIREDDAYYKSGK